MCVRTRTQVCMCVCVCMCVGENSGMIYTPFPLAKITVLTIQELFRNVVLTNPFRSVQNGKVSAAVREQNG